MMTMFFREGPVNNYADASRQDQAAFRKFFAAMLAGGVYMAPSAFEAAFVSTAHGKPELDAVISTAGRAFRSL
jgi:glutamate-1-semialdehyde 2,1-aminomutase